jgi:cytochrome c biogenesis protein CcmG/thiol:disulfide interchange protein DsbE
VKQWGRWRWVASTLVPVAAFAWLLASGFGHDPRILPSVLVRKPAPAFALQDLQTGRTVALRDLRGKVVVVNFWASWCTECIVEHADLAAAWQRYGDQGVVFVGVLFQDREANARQFVTRLGGGWPVLADPGSRTAIAYGVTGVPETVFIAPDGVIAFKQVGPVDSAVLTTWVERLQGQASQAAGAAP